MERGRVRRDGRRVGVYKLMRDKKLVRLAQASDYCTDEGLVHDPEFHTRQEEKRKAVEQRLGL